VLANCCLFWMAPPKRPRLSGYAPADLSAGISQAAGGSGSFWAMALDAQICAEITLQPIRRFGFDAAILFSDILTVPEPWPEGHLYRRGSPSLSPYVGQGFTEDRTQWAAYFEPVYEALQLTRAGFPQARPVGICRRALTLATYWLPARRR